MAGDNGQADGFSESDEAPVKTAPPPKLPKTLGKKRATVTPDPIELASVAQDGNSMDLHQADKHGTVLVTRVTASKEGGSTQAAQCGQIPAKSDFATEIYRRWGGGLYRVTGILNDGSATSVDIPVAGASLSITDDDASMEPPYLPPPPPPQPYQLPYPQNYPFGVPGAGAFTPPGGFPPPQAPGAPPWWNQAWNPHARQDQDQARQREDALKQEVNELKRSLELEKLSHEKSKADLLVLREQVRSEKERREFDAKFSLLQNELTKVQAGGAQKGENSLDKIMAMMFQMTQADNDRRARQTDAESAARREDAQKQREWLDRQVQMAEKNKQDPKELLNIVTTLASQFADRTSTVEQLRALVDLKKDLVDDDDDDDDDQPKNAFEAALELAKEGIEAWKETRSTMAPPALPGPGAPQPGGDVNYKMWLELIDEVITYAGAGDTPAVAASKLASWAQQRGAVEQIKDLSQADPVDDVAPALEEKAKGLWVPAAIKEKLTKFALFLKGPGAQWSRELCKELRG